MKKMMMAAMVALTTLCGCNSEPEYLTFKGLSLGLKPEAFVDSLLAKGYEIDTTMEADGCIFLINRGETKSSMTIEVDVKGIANLQENFERETNDSTEQLYWDNRKVYEDLYPGTFYMKKNSDLHKHCVFQTKMGDVNVVLENPFRPTFYMLLEAKREE